MTTPSTPRKPRGHESAKSRPLPLTHSHVPPTPEEFAEIMAGRMTISSFWRRCSDDALATWFRDPKQWSFVLRAPDGDIVSNWAFRTREECEEWAIRHAEEYTAENDMIVWRNALGLTQSQVAAACGRERSWYYRMENGETPIPRWFVYLTAWTRLYGLKLPFSAAEMPAKIRELRKRWGITQDDLGFLLDLSRTTVLAAEKGRPRPMGIAFAIAWIEFYGSRLPFPSMPDDIRCPHCICVL
jgi:DNA-binding XRE family transcriptional regulator